jgi:hypothetical protein
VVRDTASDARAPVAADLRSVDARGDELRTGPGVPPASLAADAGAARRWPAVAGAYGVCLLVLALCSLGREAPFVYQDEHVYGMLAQAFAAGDGYAYQDLPVTAYKTLYPALIAPAWVLFDGDAAYHAALLLNAVLWALALPVSYALARRTSAVWPALAIAVAATLTPAAVWAGMLMTEAMAYPLAALALLLAVRLLERPGTARALAALAAAAAAGTARSQLLVLVPVLLLAVALDVARSGPAWRARLREHRAAVAAAAALAVLALATVVLGRFESVVGTYASAGDAQVDAGELARYVARYTTVMAVGMALVPFVALVALATRRSAWRSPVVGPLLCVAVAATALFWANGAWASATLSPELRERYVFYPLPAVAALLGALPRLASARRVAVAAGLLVLYLLPAVPSLYGGDDDEFVQYTVGSVARRFGVAVGEPLRDVNVWALAALGLAAIVVAALHRRPSRRRVLAAVVAPTLLFQLAVLGVRERDVNLASSAFAAEYPTPRDFVDRAADGPAAFVRTGGTRQLARFHLEVWNERLRRTWRVPGVEEFNGLGADCALRRGVGGGLVAARPCTGAPLARFLVFDDERATIEVINGRLVFADGPTRMYELAPGVAPKIAYGPAPTPPAR